jgi:hypothetical protein
MILLVFLCKYAFKTKRKQIFEQEHRKIQWVSLGNIGNNGAYLKRVLMYPFLMGTKEKKHLLLAAGAKSVKQHKINGNLYVCFDYVI